MNHVREPAVAGHFYPANPEQLIAKVEDLLKAESSSSPCPKVIVAPHAGYVYSGSTAAKVYARVRNGANRISKVVLLGPAHRVGFRGMALSSAKHYRTPLGDISVDAQLSEIVKKMPAVGNLDQAHEKEHSLEVHLPFLQRCINQFSLLPIVVGTSDPADVSRVIDAVWGGPETLIVISSDLSHFLPYDQAAEKDRNTAQRITQLDTSIKGEQACGHNPLNGLLMLLKEKNLAITEVDVINSGDTAGDKSRVVGYGSFIVDEITPASPGLTLGQRQQLLSLSRQAISSQIPTPGKYEIQMKAVSPVLQEKLASFVTLRVNGNLRGCIGSLVAHRPLFEDVVHNSIGAAFKDRRFKPLTSEELQDVDIHISVLSEPKTIDITSREQLVNFLEPNVHGLILQEGEKRATYLPSVWQQIPEPEQFVAELRAKAGLTRDGWSDEAVVSIYTTEEFA